MTVLNNGLCLSDSWLRVFRSAAVAAIFSLCGAGLQAQEVPAVGDDSSVQENQPSAAPAEGIPAEEVPVAAPPAGKVIYKSVDASGKVTYTDTPPVGRPYEAINVQAANTLPGTSPKAAESNESEKSTKPVKYTRLAVTSPANDEVFGQEVEAVTLGAQLEPALQEGHTFQLYYDGSPVGDGGMSYTVTDMVRGTHTVEAKVFDSKKKLLKASGKVQFHVRRISAINKLTAAPLPAKNTKPVPSMPAGGFGSPKGAGGAGGSNAARDTGSMGGGSSARDANSSQGVTPRVGNR